MKVEWFEQRWHEDYRRIGSFDTIPGLEGEILVTHVPKDVIMGMHLHKKQTDCLVVIKGRIMVRLFSNKPGKRDEEKFVLSENTHKTLIIPPNTWHGYKALEDTILMYYINRKYDEKNADEHRRRTTAKDWEIEIR
tara:strand:- start:173 stop:580 length:408 start_codon:yes stop_codon:yes gene_type:complete